MLIYVLVFVASIRRWVNFCPILTPKNKQSCQLARGYAYRMHLPIPYRSDIHVPVTIVLVDISFMSMIVRLATGYMTIVVIVARRIQKN